MSPQGTQERTGSSPPLLVFAGRQPWERHVRPRSAASVTRHTLPSDDFRSWIPFATG